MSGDWPCCERVVGEFGNSLTNCAACYDDFAVDDGCEVDVVRMVMLILMLMLLLMLMMMPLHALMQMFLILL